MVMDFYHHGSVHEAAFAKSYNMVHHLKIRPTSDSHIRAIFEKLWKEIIIYCIVMIFINWIIMGIIIYSIGPDIFALLTLPYGWWCYASSGSTHQINGSTFLHNKLIIYSIFYRCTPAKIFICLAITRLRELFTKLRECLPNFCFFLFILQANN